MPQRTPEELKQIHADLLILSDTLNRLRDLGELWPIPMNGKTWEEEKNEFHFSGINAFNDLIVSGKIKSCEVISFCEFSVATMTEISKEYGFWNHYGKIYTDSTDYIIDDRLSVNDMIEIVEKAINHNLSPSQAKEFNSEIDQLGNSACGPRAMLENPGKPEDINNNLSLPYSKDLHCFQKA
jgi:hypothetical protein